MKRKKRKSTKPLWVRLLSRILPEPWHLQRDPLRKTKPGVEVKPEVKDFYPDEENQLIKRLREATKEEVRP